MKIKDHIKDTDLDRIDNENMIMIVELPHNRPALSYLYDDDAEYRAKYITTIEKNHYGEIDEAMRWIETADRAVACEEVIGHYLSSWRKLKGISEIRDYTPDDHQQELVVSQIIGKLSQLI